MRWNSGRSTNTARPNDTRARRGYLLRHDFSTLNIEEEVTGADLVVSMVLIPGAKAPKLLSRTLMRSMRDGSALVGVSIDQGGCAVWHPGVATAFDLPLARR
jgi:alanine dehydrogenase